MKSASIFPGPLRLSMLSRYSVLLLIPTITLLTFIFTYFYAAVSDRDTALMIAVSMLTGSILVLLLVKFQSIRTTGVRDESSNRRSADPENLDRDRIDFILDSLNDVFWSFDLTGADKNYLSRSAERVYGRPLSELISKPFFWVQYIHPEDIHLQEECHRKLSATGWGECTYRIIGHDKIVRWVYSRERAIRDETGDIIRIEGVSMDVSYLKQAEEIIEKQELQINAVVENLDMSVLILNKEGKILLINKHAQQANRSHDRNVTVGMNFFSILSPSRRNSRQQIFDNVFNTKSTISHIADYPDVDGNVRYYSVCYVPVFAASGDVEQVCIMSRDITLQKLAEDKLKEKTDLLRTVIDNLPDYVYVKDCQLKHVMNNIANLRLIGAATEEETLGKRTADYFLHGSSHQFVADDQMVIDTGLAIVNKEEEIIDSEGNKRWLLTTKVPLKDSNGLTTGIVGISRDITDRKDMELSLYISNERFKMAGRVTDDAIWDWDLSTNEAFLGENFQELFGYEWDKERVAVSEWSMHIHPDDIDRVLKSFEQVFEAPNDNKKWQCEYRYMCADGTVAHVCDRGFVICDETGKAVRMIGAMQDVTEVVEYRRSLEQKVQERTFELNKALAKEKELVEAKGRFVSMASHEFRTPLSAIQFAAGLLRKFHGKIKPEEVERKLEGIESQVKIMTVLLDDMLTLNKAEAAKLKLTPVEIDLIPFFDKIVAEIENVEGNSHKVVKKFTRSSLVVLAEEKFLRNIFVNLISNAIKFSPGKQMVYLTVELGNKYVSICVRDEGIGISSADRFLIFEPFQRGTNVNTIAGTGLGLSIVKKAVEMLGGHISLDSQEGVGTQFVVNLPFK